MVNFIFFSAMNLAVNASCFHFVEDTKAQWPSLARLNAAGRKEKRRSHSRIVLAGAPWSSPAEMCEHIMWVYIHI